MDPFGQLFATTARGAWLGNRGGQFHCTDTSVVPGRPYATRQWICCVLSFKNRRREVWGRGYTELFFSDEAAALAAGHRPCFECRRADAMAFAAAWGRATGSTAPRAPEMDKVLHAERRDEAGRKPLHAHPFDGLPDGAMVAMDNAAWLVRGDKLLQWSFAGDGPAQQRPRAGLAQVITPPSILGVLREGYVPAEWR